MPWKETDAMNERVKFVLDYQEGLYSMTEICERFGISRKTGYKWIRRYEEKGFEGLNERSRAPHTCPHKTGESVIGALVELRQKHPTWGPKKLLAVLSRRFPDKDWPAPSTAGDILKRQGLIERRRRRRKPEHPGRGFIAVEGPNDLWRADFKGEFKMQDGHYCYPLTVSDSYSRFLLGCQARPSADHEGAQAVFVRLFKEYGLPKAIITDNGAPFASVGVKRLSQLSLCWIKLGIRCLLIEPGHPEQNGSHERMHRTLKAETTRPPKANLRLQQREFDRFRKEYNEIRPHEALGQDVPAQHYERSPRPYPRRIHPIEYPGHFMCRRVGSNGTFLLKNHRYFLSAVFRGEIVGLEEIDDGIWSVYFGPVLLGRLDEREGKRVR